MNQFEIEFILSILAILGIAFNSFKKGRFTCNKFLLNAYLYIFLSLLLVSQSINIFSTFRVPSLMNLKQDTSKFLAVLLISIILLITVMSWPAKNLYSKHFLWIIWLTTMGYILYPLFQMNQSLFSIVKYQAVFVMLFLSLIAFWKPSLISINWGSTLFTLLMGLIVVQIFGIIAPEFYTSQTHYYLSYFSLLLFAFFVLFDTKRLMIKARQCVKADYINDSMGVVLDALNIFTDLFGIQN